MDAAVAQATDMDASVQLLLAVVVFEALAPVRFFRNEMVKGQLNFALATLAATGRSTHEGKRDDDLACLASKCVAASGSPSVLNRPLVLGALLCLPNLLR